MARTAAELAAIERDGPVCRRCGRPLEGEQASVHHRKLKGRGTPKREYDRVENLVVVCGSGTTLCHGWAHHNRAEADIYGWVVASWDDPATKPLRDLRGEWFTLHADGTITYARPEVIV